MLNIFTIQDLVNRWTAKTYTFLAARSFEYFGKGSIIHFPVRIHNPGNISIGKNVFIQSRVWINAVDNWAGQSHDPHIEIQDDVIIMNGVQISATKSVTIKKGVTIGRNSTIVDHNHDFHLLNGPIIHAPLTEARPVVIEEEAFVAVNCVIAPGVTIGKHSFIASNSVVVSVIPPYCLASGNPARVRRKLNPDSGKWDRVSEEVG